MKKLLAYAALAALALSITGNRGVEAQVVSLSAYPVVPVNAAVFADDTDAAFLIRYVGTGASGTVEISADDVLLKHGALGSEVADTTITRCGATDGTLDTGDADCNTLGELVDSINASANWRAVRQDGVQSDTVAFLLTLSATAANTRAGVAIAWDTSEKFASTRALLPVGFRNDISRYLLGQGTATTIRRNPFQGRQFKLYYANATSTYASGTSAIEFIEDPVSFTTTLAGETDSDAVVFKVAGGATTANKVISDFATQPFIFTQERRALVRINNSAAASAVQIVAAGTNQASAAVVN